jgi:hypothetical protein
VPQQAAVIVKRRDPKSPTAMIKTEVATNISIHAGLIWLIPRNVAQQTQRSLMNIV